MVKVVMSATCVHTMIALCIPDWVIQEIDKRRRGFLWAGKPRASGGQCMVAWSAACRPLELGGLRIPDLRIAAYGLRLRWLWLQRTDLNRPWAELDLAFGKDPMIHSMFVTSIEVEVGDGNLALFWEDRWCEGESPVIAAPDLCRLVWPATRKNRTVAQALDNKAWIADISGRLTIPALLQYIALWHTADRQHLHVTTTDTIKWRWTTAATYSSRSAYRAFFQGATRCKAAKPLWKAWAPMKVKFTMWLAVHERLWTADRRHRHGLQTSPSCSLCAQERETVDHLFHACVFTRQVWHRVSLLLQCPGLCTQCDSWMDWWLFVRSGRNKRARKGIDATVMLVSWKLWKARNEVVFRAAAPNSNEAMEAIIQEAALWVQADATCLADVGWRTPAAVNS